MDRKELAALLRKVADDGAAIPEKIRELADELEPAKPKPGCEGAVHQERERIARMFDDLYPQWAATIRHGKQEA